MIIRSAEILRDLGAQIFAAQGVPLDKAELIAETLVEANLTGHDSHGVSYYVTYSDRIKKGFIDVEAEPKIVKETPSSALVDGRWAPGQVTAMKVIGLTVEKAKGHAVSAVGAFNCNHIGRVGYYTNWAARHGVAALAFVNVGHPSVSVHNGLGKVFGTNPISAAFPTGEAKPFLMDYATSIVAAGKLSVARANHKKIPTNWVRDKEGNITDDPFALREGGWLLSFGEHKGYCLQFIAELLGAVMTGSRTGLDPETEPYSPNGVFAIAIDPNAFVGLEVFKKRADSLLFGVKGTKPKPEKRILIPGEPEWETKGQRLSEGIQIPDETWNQIVSLVKELGIEIDE